MLSSSPFTVKFLTEAKNRYKETGLFWGALTLFSGCFVATNDKWLMMKFGSSGAGKTISDRVAIETFGQKHTPLTISGRLTPAGMAKVMRKAEDNLKSRETLEAFRRAKLIFVEDLSRCTTHYLKLTALQFLAGLTKTTEMDDLTSEGGTFGGNLGDEPKKCMVAGTPSDWEEIASTSLYNEFIDRRSLTGIALMSPKEWQVREAMAKTNTVYQNDWQIILGWRDMIRSLDVSTYNGPMRGKTVGPHRLAIYEKLSLFKRFPENVFGMIDSLAEGHARINGRDEILPEDYEVIDKLFIRFLIIADMKKKELFIVEELIRSHGVLTLEDLSYRLRKRSKSEDLPDLLFVRKTITNYANSSKYLIKTLACRKNPAWVMLSQSLREMFKQWDRDVGDILKCQSK